MVEVTLFAATFAPASTPFLFACAPNALGFTTPAPNRTTSWLAIDGTGSAREPSRPAPVDDPSRGGLPRIDPVADGWRLEFQANPMALVLLSKAKSVGRVVIELPRSLVDDVLSIDRQRPPDTLLAREVDTLVIHAKRCVWWMSMAQLMALTQLDGSTRVRWRIRTVRPTGDRSARDEGVVLMSKYGRTNIRVGGRSITLGATPLEAGERVTLVDRLMDANGILRYRAIERANGERIELDVPAAEDDERIEETTAVSGLGRVERVATIPESQRRVVEAMQREGLLEELTPARHASLATPSEWSPGATARPLLDVLDRYYDSEARAVADGYIAHDARFRDETDDVVAELCARVGEPLFVQTSVTSDTLRMRGDAGPQVVQLDAGLYDVILAFNDALRDRGDGRRFFPLRRTGERLAFLLLDVAVAARRRGAGLPLDQA